MALLFTALLGVSTGLIGYFLLGQSRDDFLQEAQALGNLKIAGIIIITLMAVVVLVSFIISRFVVSRINTIASTAREIMETGDLSRRISIDTQWDDLSNLAQVLNGFLARVESLMDGIREVSNNIAHDLRTPLTHLRNQIEELKTKPATDADIDALLAESDQILGVFHSLLRIANIEKTKRHQAFEDVNLAALLQDVAELYEPLAEEKSIRLTLRQGDRPVIKGDRHLLFQLFANVLSNAIKFSPSQGEVLVALDSEKQGVSIRIDDRGPGIRASEKEAVFRRFYRGDASRSTEGHGLGLSLVKAIVDLHQGSIALEDNHPGLRVRVTLQPYQ
jgi:signal transduction histidine kinase